MEFKFTEENLKRVEEAISRYPEKRAALMPVLFIVQEQNGFISGEAMTEVARILEITPEDVLGVVTFYTMYHQKPMGKYHIQVCTNISCLLKGGLEIYSAVREKLGIGNMQVTADKLFSIEEVECMGSCGTAPMLAVNEDYFENLTKEQTEQIIESLKNKN
ncbi:MAG: NADH-quinone oxidoreductase subunit NuoE [Ignavibacteriaceae bacterium]|jgi:NADH-quinone oxidoreductase E subunit|nr:NADH-quinone oxidoreductase subunit NuoE [Ignavibacteriaceae bacterium]